MKLKKVLFVFTLLVLILCGVVSAKSGEYTDDNIKGGSLYYSVENNGTTVTITGCDSSITEAIIPSTINGKQVTRIDIGAFLNRYALTDVMIPESMTSIESSFSSCPLLTNIMVADESESFCSVDGVLFSKDMTELVSYPGGKTGNLEMNDRCYEIPNGVTSIGDDAFLYCESLTNIIIPDGVTRIGYEAFSFCTSLTEISLPSSVTGIAERAFANCDALTDVYYTGSQSDQCQIAIGENNNSLTYATWHYDDAISTTDSVSDTDTSEADTSTVDETANKVDTTPNITTGKNSRGSIVIIAITTVCVAGAFVFLPRRNRK